MLLPEEESKISKISPKHIHSELDESLKGGLNSIIDNPSGDRGTERGVTY
jgi:hypothetical protein